MEELEREMEVDRGGGGLSDIYPEIRWDSKILKQQVMRSKLDPRCETRDKLIVKVPERFIVFSRPCKVKTVTSRLLSEMVTRSAILITEFPWTILASNLRSVYIFCKHQVLYVVRDT
ncbi:hypothetical protein RRG08_045579 [Elysia crispata]|uniref:Uncharacterized protein n=1 Tax=Elysia crispata TaxID=231223 RepID=A0AAE1DW89_9GAST|nr:hypothetical protein RRG08_045579 [Elysia crispata]